jgi:hypothetical protein
MVTESIESERGCGYRKSGGLYIIGGRFGSPCGKLPIPLSVCPCCNQGIKFSRGFQWVSSALVKDAPCHADECRNCAVWSGLVEKYGLMWVGEKFYPTPEDFLREGEQMGISKRINAIPTDFKIGFDWILLAHRKAVNGLVKNKETGELEEGMTPGIFQAFKPTHFEYVVSGEETEDELERLIKRGIKPVKVIRDVQQSIGFDGEQDIVVDGTSTV